MKNKGESKNKNLETGVEEFKGYTLDELRYQRALLLVKREFLREKALKETNAIKERITGNNGKWGLGLFSPKGIAGKLIRGLDFADYFILGYQALRIGKKLGGMFRKK